MKINKTLRKIILSTALFFFATSLLILCLPESYTSWCIPIASTQKTTEKIFNQVSICLLLMAVSSLFIFIYSNKKRWIVMNLTIILFILFLAEVFALFKQPTSLTWRPVDTPDFYRSDETLGYGLKSNLNVKSVCHYNDTLLLYDVKYTIDENGQRITSVPLNKYDSSEQSIAFLGCSFTFGAGLNDDETLPFKVQNELPNTKVYNFGVSGYGPNQVLAEIENGLIDSTLKQSPKTFIFSSIQDHLRRLEDSDNKDSPKYIINQETGQIEYQGRFSDPENLKENKFFSKIKKSSLYNFLTLRKVTMRRGRLFVAHIVKIRDLLLEKYPSADFHLVYWYIFNEEVDKYIIKALRAENIHLHLISRMIPNYYDDFPNLVVRFPYEFHPSAKANQQIARYVIDRIIKRDEYFNRNSMSFTDEFDSLTIDNWYPLEFSLPESNCDMLPAQVKYEDGMAKITMAKNDSTNGKPFVSGGLTSIKYFRYGRFTASLKANPAPGTFAYIELLNPWHSEFWEHKAIDIYFRGENLNQVTFSIKSFKIDHEDQHEINKLYNLDFNASKEFHDYSIDWSKDSVSFLIDGKVAFTEKSITWDEEMNISLSHWGASADGGWLVDWLGKLDQSKLPSTFEINRFSYQPLNEVYDEDRK